MKLVASWPFAALVVTVIGAPEAHAEPPPIVRVFVAGSPEAVSGMRDALQDQCARPNLAVMVEDAASADAELLDTAHSSGLADAYVDLRPDNETRIVVVDGQTHAQLEQRTLERAPSLDLAIESVAQVVCSAIDSTLAAHAAAAPASVAAPAPAAPAPAAPAPAAPAPAPPPTPSPIAAERVAPARGRVASAWVGVFGVGSDYGAGLNLGGGAVVGASYGSSPLRFGGSLWVDGFPTVGLAVPDAQASLNLYSVRLLPTLEWDATPRLGLFAALGGGADWLRVFAGSPPRGGVSRGDTSSVQPILSSLIGGKLALAPHLSAWLALGADVDLARRPYVNQANGTPTPFFESPRARPVGLAGLALSFGHEPNPDAATPSARLP